MKKQYILLMALFALCQVTMGQNNILHEAEDTTKALLPEYIRIEAKPASGGFAVHIGPDNDNPDEGIGSALIYDLPFTENYPLGVFEVKYSEDTGVNIIHVYVNDVKKGCFITQSTGEWNTFRICRQKINLGYLGTGINTIKLELTKSGNWGAIVDYFKITKIDPSENCIGAYNYIRSLIVKHSGMVSSSYQSENFTTLYKNALAAITFIHENEESLAEGIFEAFKLKMDKPFTGFPQYWNPQTGNPTNGMHWEGDNAFLLIALNYYHSNNGSYGDYKDMADSLAIWLTERIDSMKNDQAEGIANMYTALKCYKSDIISNINYYLDKLKNRWNDTKNYQSTLDHIVRGSLCFSDTSGFKYIEKFKITEEWMYNGKKVTALTAYFGKDFINNEITAQILLAWKIWGSPELPNNFDLSSIKNEIDSLWLFGESTPDTVTCGLPYFLTYKTSGNQDTTVHGWGHECYSEPIIDPTCFMLFHCWNFNPFDTCNGVSLIRNNSKNILNVYPNPSNDKITIEIPQEIIPSILSIYNINGQEIIKQQINDNMSLIDIRNLTRGIYFVKLINKMKVEERKIIKE